MVSSPFLVDLLFIFKGSSKNYINSKRYVGGWSTVYSYSIKNKTKEDFIPKRGLGQQDKKALLAVEK